MSEQFKITEEEINETLMYSPHALPDSPSLQGLGARQIKKYFYDFIRQMSKRINGHMSDVGDELDGVKDALVNAQQDIGEALALAESAYDLASGKSKVRVYGDARSLFSDILDSMNTSAKEMCIGDFVLVAEKNQPDFVVYSSPDDVKIPPAGFADVNTDNYLTVPLETGTAYAFLNGFVLVGIESGIDTSELATKEELRKHYKISDTAIFQGDLNELNSAEAAGAYRIRGQDIVEGVLTNAPSTWINGRLLVESLGSFGILQTIRGVDVSHTMCEWHREGYFKTSENEFVWGKWESYATDAELSEIQGLAESAYDLARGKSKVHVYPTVQLLFGDLCSKRDVNEGDILIVAEKGVPDFIVGNMTNISGAVPVISTNSAAVVPRVGERYFFPESEYLIIGIESGIDASQFSSEYELINETELTAERSGDVVFSLDKDGQAFKLSKALVVVDSNSLNAVYSPATLSLRLCVINENLYRALWVPALPTVASKYARAVFTAEVVTPKLVKVIATYSNTLTSLEPADVSANFDTKGNLLVPLYTSYIERVGVSSNNIFQAGVKIKLYGVRCKGEQI